jgi:ABC-type branched-subunit amino acid transport system ATPase component
VRAIIGPNGAGKSSMLNVINGVYHPQDGKILYRGEERAANGAAHGGQYQGLPVPSRTSRCSRA